MKSLGLGGGYSPKIIDGAAFVNTSNPLAPKFVAADYPAVDLLLNSESLLRDTTAFFVDRANGVVFRTAGDDTWTVTDGYLDGLGQGGADALPVVTGTIPAMGDEHAVLICVGVNSPSDPFFEIGDATDGVGLIVDTGSSGAGLDSGYATLTSTNYVGTTANNVPALTGTVTGAMLTINKNDTTDAYTPLRMYRFGDTDSSVDIKEGAAANSGGAAAITGTWGAYDATIKLNAETKVYLCALIQSADPRMLTEEFCKTALQWMVRNPGYLYPGYKSFA